MTGRRGLGNGGQETAALRPKDSAESNEGHLLPQIPPETAGDSAEESERGGITTLEGKLAASPE